MDRKKTIKAHYQDIQHDEAILTVSKKKNTHTKDQESECIKLNINKGN